ncbi:MAG: hypothetical protein ABEL76_10295 [Bradymonadaceae bacterium]
MRMTRANRLPVSAAAVASLLLLGSGCDGGGSTGGSGDGRPTDTAADVSEDARDVSEDVRADSRARPDGGSDAAADGGGDTDGADPDGSLRDVAPDVPLDTAADGTADVDRVDSAGGDVEADVGPDPDPDVAPDVRPDVQRDVRRKDTGSQCGSISTERGCRQANGCKIWRASCNGKLVAERCIPVGLQPSPPACRQVAPEDCEGFQTRRECHLAGSSCQWLQKGCGGNNPVKTGCYPDVSCTSDGDCPPNYSCDQVTYDPCVNPGLSGLACGSCGGGKKVCVPP